MVEKRVPAHTSAAAQVESRETEHNKNEPRNDWSMGVVVKEEPDSKGFVRSAFVKTETSELRRPVHKRVLKLTAEDRMDTSDDSKDVDKCKD